MAIPSSGQVSLNTVKNEFGDPNSDGQYKLSEYYRDGDNDPIPNSQTSVPASGAISIGNFRGTSADPTVYYIREGSGSNVSFAQTSEISEMAPYPALAACEVGFKLVLSGTTIQIYAWDEQYSDVTDTAYYNLAGNSVAFQSYNTHTNSLLIYSVNTGFTSGYKAYYGLTLVSGSDIARYRTYGTMTGLTTSTSGVSVTSTPQGARFGYLTLAPDSSEHTEEGLTRVTFTMTKSGSTTYTSRFNLDLSSQATQEDDECEQCCIHTDMLVHTPKGEIHIKQLHIGSPVYSYNFDTGEKVEDKIIRKRYVKRNNEYKVNELKMTADHPVYLQSGRLASLNPEQTLSSYNMSVDQLIVGDKMMTANNELEVVHTIEKIEGEQPNYTLYTENGNFYASPNGDNAILVDSVVQET